MKPYHTLLYLVAVFAVLVLLAWIFPKDGIQLTDEVSLKFTTVKDIFSPEEVEKVDISEIVEVNEVPDEEEFEPPAVVVDSAVVEGEVVYYKPVAIPVDTVMQALEFPGNDRSMLFSIFEHLANLLNTREHIRILHYGDSQIEGDRMTSYFRYRLQSQFGGSGMGLVPMVQAYDFNIPITPVPSDNWERYTVYGRRDTMVQHKKYGVLSSFSRFAPLYAPPEDEDTTFAKNIEILQNIDSMRQYIQSPTYEGTVTFQKSRLGYDLAKTYRQCRLFYGNLQRPATVELYRGEELVRTDSLKISTASDETYDVLQWQFAEPPEEVTLKFKGKDSPDIYGMTFEDTTGVSVDNIGMRGCSGTIFTKMDFTQLQQMYEDLNVKLFVLQFGGNVVPYDSEGNYENYSNWLYSQFSALHRIVPDASIIVIGPADMSKKDGDNYVTHHNVIPVRNAVRLAALRSGCAFWDMFEAMGGKNSMASWVFAEPSLAEKDFTHFNPRGSNIIARMFYNAFISEYNYYLNNHYTEPNE